MRKMLLVTVAILVPTQVFAQANSVANWQTGTTSTGAPINAPVSTTNPLPVTVSSGGSASPTNLTQVLSSAVTAGAGASTANTPRVTTSTDSTIGTITNPVGVKGIDGSGIASGFNPVPVLLAPSATQGVSTFPCATVCASAIVSGGHGLYGLTFSSTVTGWLLIYDATSCSANGTVTPKKAFAYTVANTTMGVSWNNAPMIDTTGTAACFSTTGPYTATASTTAYISLDYK